MTAFVQRPLEDCDENITRIHNYTINLCKEHNYPMHMDETPLNFNIQSNLTINHTEVNTVKVRKIGMKKNHQLLCWRVLVTNRN